MTVTPLRFDESSERHDDVVHRVQPLNQLTHERDFIEHSTTNLSMNAHHELTRLIVSLNNFDCFFFVDNLSFYCNRATFFPQLRSLNFYMSIGEAFRLVHMCVTAITLCSTLAPATGVLLGAYSYTRKFAAGTSRQ